LVKNLNIQAVEHFKLINNICIENEHAFVTDRIKLLHSARKGLHFNFL